MFEHSYYTNLQYILSTLGEFQTKVSTAAKKNMQKHDLDSTRPCSK